MFAAVSATRVVVSSHTNTTQHELFKDVSTKCKIRPAVKMHTPITARFSSGQVDCSGKKTEALLYVYLDIPNCLGIDHECDGQMDRPATARSNTDELPCKVNVVQTIGGS